MRFLLHWQHVAGEQQLKGPEGLAAVVGQLDGYEVAAGAWEQEVLAVRVQDYQPDFIDRLCLSGRVAWGRLSPANGSGKAPLRSSPIALMLREHAGLWRAAAEPEAGELSSEAGAVYEALRSRGAAFFPEIVSATGQLRTQAERSLGGRFVSGFGGEQFALADAVGRLRGVRKLDKSGELVALSGADPLNLVGIVTPEARVGAIAPNRVLYRDGLAIAALEGGELRRLAPSEFDDDTLKTLFWRRSSALGFRPPGLSEASRKRLLEHKVRVPLPG